MKLSPVAQRRLTILADFLAKLRLSPKREFNMEWWGSNCPDGDCGARDCGTTACAAGWATTIPAFRKAGFVSIGDDDLCPTYAPKRGIVRPVSAFLACARFFRLTNAQVEYLFDPEKYEESPNPPKKVVVERIRTFVKTNGKVETNEN